MESLFTTTDLVVFFGSLFAVMAIGLWAGRKEDTSEDFYLAGKTTKWWGVAGSVFGSNVSANHIMGMMGVGYMFGFAQSHLEITAIAGLLMLCYAFLPMYRKLNIYTLSEYLGRRYNDGCRLVYALIMILIMVVIQMVPGFYVGSRSLNTLVARYGQTAKVSAVVGNDGTISELKIDNAGRGYADTPKVSIVDPNNKENDSAAATVTVDDGKVTSISLDSAGSKYDPKQPPTVELIGGAEFDTQNYSPGDVNPQWYIVGILIMAFVTGTYTILGGLKAVIVTDVIQSVFVLLAGLTVAGFAFYADIEIDGQSRAFTGWTEMAAMDAASEAPKLHLYKAADHPTLPWTGVLSGLMILHFYYWGANQFIVQRALAASTDKQAKMGIITAGFFKLLIPFFSIGTGIAAFYLLGEGTDPDIVFLELMEKLIKPVGCGLVGLVAAGIVGAILSSIDSMMNSSATIVTFDLYKRYIDPAASERKLIWVGRLCIVFFIAVATMLTIFFSDPNSKKSFFVTIMTHQGYLVAGVVVAFLLGMLWKRATGEGALVAMIAGVVLSYRIPYLYPLVKDLEFIIPLTEYSFTLAGIFGDKLNFFHTAFAAAVISAILHVVVSLACEPDEERSQLTWAGVGLFTPTQVRGTVAILAVSMCYFALLGIEMVNDSLAFKPYPGLDMVVSSSTVAAWAGALYTFALFLAMAVRTEKRERDEFFLMDVLYNDRFYAGILAGLAVFMMYYYY